MSQNNRREIYCGLLLMLIGIGAAIGSFNYHIGTLARMGPGYFPLALGILLTGVGGLIMLTPPSPLEGGDESPPISREQVRSWVLVLSGMLAFIVLGLYVGLVPAALALIFLAALGDRSTSVKTALLLATSATLVAVVIFHYGLKMQFPLFR